MLQGEVKLSDFGILAELNSTMGKCSTFVGQDLSIIFVLFYFLF
jgi:hypothetical protein